MNIKSTSKVVFVAWWIVGTTFIVASMIVFRGGSAMTGKIRDGHYFVSKGTYVFEVSRPMFYLSYGHQLLWMFLTVASVLLYAIVAVQTQNLNWLNEKPKTED